MNRIRVIGVALVAVLAFSAVAVASASATKFKTTTEEYPATAKAKSTNTHTFKIGGTSVECKKATFETGELTAASETLEIPAAYAECKAFGFVSAEVKMNGCKFKFHTNREVDIVACGGKSIEIVAATCTVKVAEQSKLKEAKFKNIGTTPKEVEVEAKVIRIKYTTNKGFGCPAEGEADEYSGKAVAKGFKGATQVGIEVA